MTFSAPAFFRMPASLPGAAKRNASGASGSSVEDSTNRSKTSLTLVKNGLASSGPQTINETYPLLTITLSASRTAVTGSPKNIADDLLTTTSNVRERQGIGRTFAELDIG